MAEPWTVNANIAGREPEHLAAARVSEQFFTVLGAPMLHGRPFLPQEYQRGARRVGDSQSRPVEDRFGGDRVHRRPGACVSNDADTYTVVGVLPPDFELRLFDNRVHAAGAALWLPKQGFEQFEPNLRGTGYLERPRPAGARRVGRRRRGRSSTRCRRSSRASIRRPTRTSPRRSCRCATHLVGQPPRRAAAAARRGGDPPDRGLRQRRESAARARRRPRRASSPCVRRSARAAPAGPADARRKPPARGGRAGPRGSRSRAGRWT